MARIGIDDVPYWEEQRNLLALGLADLRAFKRELRAVLEAREAGIALESIEPKPDLVDLDREALRHLLRCVRQALKTLKKVCA